MDTPLSALLLGLTPLLPLLLAFPALRSALPWPCHVALLPALLLLVLPTGHSIDLPWLLLGSGLGIAGGMERSLLAASVLLWAVAAGRLKRHPVEAPFTTAFLLTMAGSLGALLATGLAGFFAFSVLMGYGFYALLVTGADRRRWRAARTYLILLVLADLALFEALLIAAAASRELEFPTVHQAVAQSPSLLFYLSMVWIGFAARAGLWPLHFWLRPAFDASRPTVAWLLGGVPVAVALLGIVRWLPLGTVSLPLPGLILLGAGGLAMLHAILVGIRGRLRPGALPACAVIFCGGLLTAALGAGLSDAAAWNRYGALVYPFIAFGGVAAALLVAVVRWRRGGDGGSATPEGAATDDALPWFERWPDLVIRWGLRVGGETLPRLRAAWQAKTGRLWQRHLWQRVLGDCERSLQRWACAITLFLLLGVVAVLAGAWG